MDDVGQRQLVAALETLPNLTRAAFLLSARDNLSYAEIGWRCGITIDEVMVRIGDALLGIDREMCGRPSLAGRVRRALLPYRDAWATARAREGDRRLTPWTSPDPKPNRRHTLEWIARAYELLFG
jgi:Sigma-70, region 4